MMVDQFSVKETSITALSTLSRSSIGDSRVMAPDKKFLFKRKGTIASKWTRSQGITITRNIKTCTLRSLPYL